MTEATLTLGEVVGRNLSSRREQLGMTQDEAARRLRIFGLRWNRSTLAKVERGERSVTLEELVLLAAVLGPEPAFYLRGAPGELVTLSPDASAPRRAIEAVLRGQQVRQADLRFANLPPLDPAWPELDQEALAFCAASSGGEPEQKAAERLGVEPVTVARAAMVKWGLSLSEERDDRVARLGGGSDPRTVQAVRGHVTRELLEELRPVIAGRTKRARKR